MLHFPDTNNIKEEKENTKRCLRKFLNNKGLQIALDMSVAFQPCKDPELRVGLNRPPFSPQTLKGESAVRSIGFYNLSCFNFPEEDQEAGYGIEG